jgi:hypothetical protein
MSLFWPPSLRTCDAICRQLGCQPGDLLAFNADGTPAEEKLATDAL